MLIGVLEDLLFLSLFWFLRLDLFYGCRNLPTNSPNFYVHVEWN